MYSIHTFFISDRLLINSQNNKQCRHNFQKVQAMLVDVDWYRVERVTILLCWRSEVRKRLERSDDIFPSSTTVSVLCVIGYTNVYVLIKTQKGVYCLLNLNFKISKFKARLGNLVSCTCSCSFSIGHGNLLMPLIVYLTSTYHPPTPPAKSPLSDHLIMLVDIFPIQVSKLLLL